MDTSGRNTANHNALGLSSDVLAALADYANIGLLNWHIPSGEITLNEPIVKLAGYEMYEIPHSGDSRRMLTFEDDYAMVENNIRACIEGRQDRYQIIYRMNRRDGSIVLVMESAFVYERDAEGHAVRLAAMVADLSVLRQSEQKIQALEQENRRLREGMSKGDMAEQIHLLRAANAAAAGIVGGFYQDYETTLFQALKTIGESLDADSLQIYRNVPGEESMRCYLRSGWEVEQNLAAPVKRERLWDYDAFLPDWRQTLRHGRNLLFSGDEIPRSLLVLPGMDRARSIMLIPLILHGAFWGMLRMDERRGSRVFTPGEAEIIGSSTIIVASSISRSETLGKLNKAREEAMASTRAKGEFLSRMSHEIRTPMNAIIGMSAIARKAGDLDKVQYALDKIDTSSRQLLSIINDVLDMSKIDSGKFEIHIQPFDFDKMLQNVLNVIQVKLDEKHQTLHFEPDGVFTRQIISDELRLSQVLINLLGNAVKFTPEAGRITLTVRHRSTDPGSFRLHIEVADTGIGISEENKKRLFNQFEQADTSISRRFGGTGLGLAISKRIINLMGGDIWVESEEGHGAVFIFEINARWGDILSGPASGEQLPVFMENGSADVKNTVPCGSGEEQPEADWSGKTILLAEDIEINREIMHSLLDDTGACLVDAENGEVAVALFSAEPDRYDLILMDVQMPSMDGLSATRAIRALSVDRAEKIPIVAMTANAFKEDQEAVLAAGMNGHIAKPVEFDKLYSTLGHYLNGRE